MSKRRSIQRSWRSAASPTSGLPVGSRQSGSAKLPATKTDTNLLLLKTEVSAGHGGAADRFDRLKEYTLQYAFALEALHLV